MPLLRVDYHGWYIADNTIVAWGHSDGLMHHLLTAFSHNNLFISASNGRPVWTARLQEPSQYSVPASLKPSWKTDLDYDGFDWDDSPNRVQ